MRSDMSKILVERPRCRIPKRAGSWYPRGSMKMKWYPDFESAPSREGMGHVYGIKRLNENLQPLVRFLRSNVGRSWDKVHSEIAAHVRCTSAVQLHVLQHLAHFVELCPILIAGVAHERRGWGSGPRLVPIASAGMQLRFYVHPRTRSLCLAPIAPRKKRRSLAHDPDRRVLSPTRELRRLDGVWYEVTVIPQGDEGAGAFKSKKQLGTRAIARLGLRETRR
jgi:hypothetical protein